MPKDKIYFCRKIEKFHVRVKKILFKMEEIKEVNKILFSVASADDIRKKSAYVVNNPKFGDDKTNTVYDHRGGAVFGKKCATCKQYEQTCPGHFGHIELSYPIVNPIFFNHAINVLRVICFSCSKLLIAKEHLEFSNILKFDGEKRLLEISNKIKKFTKCFHCESEKREYKIVKCNDLYNYAVYDDNIEITDEEIKNILDDVDDETANMLGISHPKNCCMEVFPVIPPCCRPYEFVNNVIKEDDLTKQLIDIIKANISVANAVSQTDKKSAIINLKIKIEGFCRNPKNKIRNGNNDPIKGIRERLTGKDGQLRDNLMGKRTEMSGRTVIGPGPNLKVDEVGIPESMARTLTFPINVYESNFAEIINMVKNNNIEKISRNGKIIRIDLQMYSEIMKFLKPGDVVISEDGKETLVEDCKFKLKNSDKIFRNGQDITPEKIPQIKEPDVKIGDVAHRRIINGDWVLMNRQPTLWKGSMMAFKAVISKRGLKTFTFNLAVCKAFNSDFDGDEQNAHFPQSIESSVELRLLSTPQECLLSSTNGTPVIVILQDALLGSYLMSIEKNLVISRGEYDDLLMSLSRPVNFYLKRKDEIRETLKKLGLYKDESSLRESRSILSLIIPREFCLNNEDLKITEGVIHDGALTKKYLGATRNSLIFMFKMEFGGQECMNFINDIQFMTNKWLLRKSFTVNLDDCRENEKITDIIDSRLNEAEFIEGTVLNKSLAEAKINMCLSNAKDVGMKIAEEEMSHNNIVQTIKAGSKGDFFNLGQVKGILGQQIINGKRIDKLLDNGTRSLVHYPRNGISVKDKYESRGFVMNGFYKGINPKEFFFHSMSGRQGVCDTAMTTFMAGYNMRKLVKLTEDIKILNDGTVGDSYGNLYSFAYGDTGSNPETKHFDLERVIEKLNKI